MIAGGELDGWHVAETGMQAFPVVQLSNKPVQMLLSVVQVEIILEIDFLGLCCLNWRHGRLRAGVV